MSSHRGQTRTESKPAGQDVESSALGPTEDKAVAEPGEPTKDFADGEIALTVPAGHARVRFAHHHGKHVPGEVDVLPSGEAQQLVAGHFAHVVDDDDD